MLDFVRIETDYKRPAGRPREDGMVVGGSWHIHPNFIVGKSKDLMIRGGDFYAVWDEEAGFWCLDAYRVAEIVDGYLFEKRDEIANAYPEALIEVSTMSNYKDRSWEMFKSYCRSAVDDYEQLDQKLMFKGQKSKREDFVTKTLPYKLSNSEPVNYERLVSVLYTPNERRKFEWGVGSILAGESTSIQKFFVFYGSAGTGKSTVLNIIEKIFEGYSCTFDAKSLTTGTSSFALEPFRTGPLVAVQHDADLSRIDDNTRLNSLVSHEPILVNEKRKSQYEMRFNATIFVGSNDPVKVTNAKAGVMRRLIEISPTGDLVDHDEYDKLIKGIEYELGAIANHCLQVYNEYGPHAYDRYRSDAMMGETNDFYNFVLDHFETFLSRDWITLKEAWHLYCKWAEESKLYRPFSKRSVKNELKDYFEEYYERKMVTDGNQYYNVYVGFKKDIFFAQTNFANKADIPSIAISMGERPSTFDAVYSEYPAQYATDEGIPSKRWSDVTTKLGDLDTSRLHYVKVPENHIVLDFDLKNAEGEKDRELNLREASKFPHTYAEFSKSGAGIHLHYIYEGDPSELDNQIADGIEIKVFKGNQALRRKLTYCNDSSIMHIQSGLPLKPKGDKVLDFKGLKNEQALRTLIAKNLRKEIHAGTKPSIDFIYQILEDAYSQGMRYDVSDMYTDVLVFANNSTHHSAYCVKLVTKMKFSSEDKDPAKETWKSTDSIVFFDVEVYPNLFVVCWKYDQDDAPVIKMINPDAKAISELCKYKLVGFNNRNYDNHILYGRMIGYDNQQLYSLSKSIVSKDRTESMAVKFREAYNLSYADIYDFASAPHKMSLKKWEVKLGIHHQEMGLPWDEPVDESLWDDVVEYCSNDVEATRALFHHIHEDFVAREILAKLSGLPINSGTRSHMTKIIFGNDKNPTDKLVYTDLSTTFPGYKYDFGVSTYRGYTVGEGGFVFAIPGMYRNVKTFDVASMHPASILALNYLGPYTQTYADIRQARIFIKRGEIEKAKELMDGKLAQFIDDPNIDNKGLADALKTALNSLYGYTCARFDCPFKHPKNKDNIVAKRGALFMINLLCEVQDRGFTVVHVKTDSIKVVDPTPELEEFILSYGKEYGYEFEVESEYERFCLVNDAVYIAKDKNGWHAIGAQFQQPYVFKTLFSKEELTFDDLCEVRSVNEGNIFLDYNEDLGEDEHKLSFVGRVGLFCPILPGNGAGIMYRVQDGKNYAVQKTKGYRWFESERVKAQGLEDQIDLGYFEQMAKDAVNTISKYGKFEEFVKE